MIPVLVAAGLGVLPNAFLVGTLAWMARR